MLCSWSEKYEIKASRSMLLELQLAWAPKAVCSCLEKKKTQPKKKSFELKIIAQMEDSRTLGMRTRRAKVWDWIREHFQVFRCFNSGLSNGNQEGDALQESEVGCKIFNVIGSAGYCSVLKWHCAYELKVYGRY